MNLTTNYIDVSEDKSPKNVTSGDVTSSEATSETPASKTD